MKNYKLLDYVLNFLLLVLIFAIFFLIKNNIDYLKLIRMLQPLFWLLTLYCSMVFYFYWYLIEVKLKEREECCLDNLSSKKKKYRILGVVFGFLLLFSILFN